MHGTVLSPHCPPECQEHSPVAKAMERERPGRGSGHPTRGITHCVHLLGCCEGPGSVVGSMLKQMLGFPKDQEKPPGVLLDLRPRPEGRRSPGGGRPWGTERRCLSSRRPQSFLPLFEACLALEGCPGCPATSDSVTPQLSVSPQRDPDSADTAGQGKGSGGNVTVACHHVRPSGPVPGRPGVSPLVGGGQSHSSASGPALHRGVGTSSSFGT